MQVLLGLALTPGCRPSQPLLDVLLTLIKVGGHVSTLPCHASNTLNS